LPGIIFAHGYLGSRYDMMHICEELASKGFVVAAPEMPESLSASYEPNERVQRSCIVDETIGMMQRNFAVGDNLGIFGHSAGGGTSTNVARPFKLGRCAIAGFRGYGGDDPLLVVASVGDGIIPLDGIKSALPPGEYTRTRTRLQIAKSVCWLCSGGLVAGVRHLADSDPSIAGRANHDMMRGGGGSSGGRWD
jgi:dienelactone hydrolase